MKRLVSVFFCVIFLITLTALPVSANSAQTHWEGTTSTGVIITDAECPVVVEHELLTFDISEFPRSYYGTYHEHEAEFQAYSAGVTAQYTFYNPADYAVTATVLFPFGCEPDYVDSVYEDADMDKYGVTVNGEVVESTLRHSWSPYSDQFELEEDLALLHDGFMENEFYSPDLTVTQYTYTVSDVDRQTYPASDVALEWRNRERTKLYFPSHSSFHRQESGAARIGTGTRDGVFDLYLIGEPLSEPLRWTVYQNGGLDDGTEIGGTVTLSATETVTFRELAMTGWGEDCGVLEHDWYNAALTEFLDYERNYDCGLTGRSREDLNLTYDLMGWYEYEITLEPGERITNTVTAPMYPAINEGYEPPIYTYTYLLSPAQTWTQFGTLDIVVNTPYYMTESGMEGFAKTDNGYTLTLDGLPEGELEFTLCSEETPRKDVNYRYLAFFLVPIGYLLLAVAAVVCLVILLRKWIRKKKDNRK